MQRIKENVSLAVEKIKTVSKQITGVEGATRAIFVMLTIADKNVNGEPAAVSDSHIHLALGNTKASLEQYGYVVANSAWVADLPAIELTDGESARIVNVATMEKITPDVIEDGEEISSKLEEE